MRMGINVQLIERAIFSSVILSFAKALNRRKWDFLFCQLFLDEAPESLFFLNQKTRGW